MAIKKPKVPEGVHVEVEWVDDIGADLSMLGTYSDEKTDCAILVSDHRHQDPNSFKYFISANHGTYKFENWKHLSGKELQKIIKKHGSLKNATRKYALQDFERYESHGSDWVMQGCRVTVRYGPYEEDDSLWGIESDSSKSYKKEIEAQCLSEALARLEKVRQKPRKERKA